MDSSVDLTPEQQAQQKKSRRSFIFVCLAFLVPIILAKMALDQHWFNYGVTNQGQLIENELSLSDLGLNHLHDDLGEGQKPWLLIYHLPKNCEQACLQLFNSLSNTYVALGKDMKRVNLVAITHSGFNENDTHLINVKRWQLTPPPADINFPQSLPSVFVVDPLGNIVVGHQPPSSVEELPSFGKAIVADFKILLKLSRIG